MITFNTRELQRALKELQPAIGNSILPICDHFLCTVKDNSASLRATNLQMTIIARLPSESPDIELLLPFYDVFKPLGSIKAESITIKPAKKNKMVCSDGEFSFPSEDIKAFPGMIETSEMKSVSVDESFIVDMQEASKHVSTNEINVQYTGIGLDFNGQSCWIMATNQSKIYAACHACEYAGKYHVPVAFVKALFGAGELLLSDNFIGLKQDNKETYIRLSDQKFINIVSLIRKDISHNLSFALSDILPKLDIITSYADTATVTLSFLGNQMDVSYINKDFEREYCTSIRCENATSVDAITFNPANLKSMLIAADEEDCKLWIQADKKPVFIFGNDKQMMLSPQVNN